MFIGKDTLTVFGLLDPKFFLQERARFLSNELSFVNGTWNSIKDTNTFGLLLCFFFLMIIN